MFAQKNRRVYIQQLLMDLNLFCRSHSDVEDMSNDIRMSRTFSASSPGIKAYTAMPLLLCQQSYVSTRVLLAYCIGEDSWILCKYYELGKGAAQSLKSLQTQESWRDITTDTSTSPRGAQLGD